MDLAPLHEVLSGLAAAGEATRLRLLAILCDAELTVSELVAILGQSQPRISRHLKLLVEARLVERHREGSWVFLLAAQSGPGAALVRSIVSAITPDDATLVADRARLQEVRAARADQATAISRPTPPPGTRCARCTSPKTMSSARSAPPSVGIR